MIIIKIYLSNFTNKYYFNQHKKISINEYKYPIVKRNM